MNFMKKTFFSFKHLVTLALGLTMSVGAFANADAKVQMSVSATSINYGETVNVSVTLDKAAKYLVEIPTDKFSGETFDFTGGDGTGDNQQKTYTAIACGTATFTLNVTTGKLQGDASQSVTIYPYLSTPSMITKNLSWPSCAIKRHKILVLNWSSKKENCHKLCAELMLPTLWNLL